MKKKFSVAIMATAMACTIGASAVLATGCGNRIPDFEMPEEGFNTDAQVEITFSHTMGADLREVLDACIEQFNVLYPNIKVTHEQVGDYPDLRDDVITKINAGRQPNLAYCYPDHVAMFNQAGAVLPLNDFLSDGEYKDMKITLGDGTEESLNFTKEQEDTFIEGYWKEGYQFDDGKKMYTLPFAKSTEVLYYNKTYFDANDIKVPTTWDEMEEACEKIKALDTENKVTPLGYDSEANWFITMCEQYGSPYTSASGKHYLFDNQTNRDFVKKFKGWYDKGYVVTKALNESYTSDLFKKQQSYMCIGSSAGAKNQIPTRTAGVYPFEVGVAPIPQVDSSNPKVISQGPSICIFKNNDPQKVLASWLFAKYFTTNIAFQAQFSMVSGYAPVIKTVTESTAYQNFLARPDSVTGADRDVHLPAMAAKLCMELEDCYYTSPAFVGSSEARDQVGFLMQAVFSSKGDISKAIDQAFKDAMAECEYIVG